MVFNSFQFMVFFPIVVLGYYLLPYRYRWIWLLISSFYFYMSWNPKYIILILTTIIITYLSGIGIWKANEKKRYKLKKLCAALSIVINIGILFFFKYFDFAVDSINKILNIAHIKLLSPSFDVLLPVGISFYTFQALSYTLDVYRDENFKVEKNIGKYALFVTFFPQLVAGPIERSGNLLSQIHENHPFNYEKVREGLILMAWGLFEKIVIADRAALVVNQVYGNIVDYTGFEVVVATVLFAVQVYCDFCGYSDIAIGAAKVMGFQLMDNFRQPYLSRSIKEFWRRWHISLSSWLRDYIYIPLGGSRCSNIKKYRNIMITFLISGLWHGANWTYVIWGGLHGIYQIVGDVTAPVRKKMLNFLKIDVKSFSHKMFQTVFTFGLVDMAWVFFRADSLGQAVLVFKQMFCEFNIEIFWNSELYAMGLEITGFVVLCISVGVLFIVSILRQRISIMEGFLKQHVFFRWFVYIGAVWYVFLILLVQGIGNLSQEFIYFQF